ncbi:MAG TPA: COX15/CtaA family protein, partial [Anaerolineales bacterium]|nr:COX15/CtaA family protein [Anaerolineales bacterium]
WFPPMIGGVFYEHGHRMIAGFVGILTVILTVWLWLKEPRRWVKILGTVALLSVIAQAVLGGITVLYFLPTWVSTFHATLGQTFFCMIVSLAIFTSKWWSQNRTAAPGSENLTGRFLTATILIYIQLILGSWMRHSQAALAIPDFPLALGRLIPPFTNSEIAIHFSHRVGAFLVLCMISWNLISALRSHRSRPDIMRPSMLLFFLVCVQITLGAFTVWTKTAVIFATLHMFVGALLLATSLVLTLRSYRLARPFQQEAKRSWDPAVRTA